jgi:hypothetical protein
MRLQLQHIPEISGMPLLRRGIVTAFLSAAVTFVKVWLTSLFHSAPGAVMSDPVVTVPLSQTNAVISQTWTQVLGWLQAFALGAAGYVLGDATITSHWPAWVAAVVAAGAAGLRATYNSTSNQTTTALVKAAQAPAAPAGA